jgi:hypothetical protein
MLRAAVRSGLALSIAAGLMACAANPSGTALTPIAPESFSPETAQPTSEPTDELVESLIRGDWRRHPVEPPADLIAALEPGCLNEDPAIGQLPVALVDLRGEELATVVFGDETAGYACSSGLEDPAATPEVRALVVPPVPEDGVEVLVYEVVESPGPTRILLIGRVGPLSQPRPVAGSHIATQVIAGFDDETFVWGSFASGWYAMWWPGVQATDGVAATNARNEVLAGAVPSLP